MADKPDFLMGRVVPGNRGPARFDMGPSPREQALQALNFKQADTIDDLLQTMRQIRDLSSRATSEGGKTINELADVAIKHYSLGGE